MTKVHIRYTIRPGEVSENIALLRDFFDELEGERPPGLVYEAYQMEDGITFVHFVDSATNAAAFGSLLAYRRYRDTLQARCLEPLQMIALKNIGTYRAGLREVK